MKKIAIKLRIKPPKRRDPAQRLRARLYYRKNRSKIRLQRRKYLRIHKTQMKHRKSFMRYKPVWFKKIKHKGLHKPIKFKLSIPKIKKVKPHFFKLHKK